MEDIIIRLQKFSLRWAIVILLVVSIGTSLLGSMSEGVMKFASLILFAASSLFYATWCAHAVTDIKKAYRTFSIIIVVSFLNTVWFLLSETKDMDGMRSMNAQIYMTITSSYPTQLLQSLASAAAFIYAFSAVTKKFRLCWGGMIIILLLNFMNLFVLVTGDATISDFEVYYHGVDTYLNANMIIGILTLILYIVLLVKGGNDPIDDAEINLSSENVSASHSATINSSNSTTNTSKFQDNAQQLFKLKELLDNGVLTQEEFESEKAKILNK